MALPIVGGQSSKPLRAYIEQKDKGRENLLLLPDEMGTPVFSCPQTGTYIIGPGPQAFGFELKLIPPVLVLRPLDSDENYTPSLALQLQNSKLWDFSASIITRADSL